MPKFDPNDATAALGSVIRINYALDSALEASTNVNPHQWFFSLRAFYREIYPKLKANEVTEIKKKIHNLKAPISEWVYTSNEEGNTSVTDDLYEELDDLHTSLMKLADNHKLLITDKDIIQKMTDFVKG